MKQQYIDTLQRLYKTNIFLDKKQNLNNILNASKFLGNPQKDIKTIHISGTNGKGTVANKISKALEHSNYKTGLFTSPHLFTFRERIQINSTLISEFDTVKYLNKVNDICQKENIVLTYFEYVYLAAILYYRDQNIDIMVAEGGLGVKLDAVNICHPIQTVITTISLDHVDSLGPTVQDIAEDKSHIIKPKIPLILGHNTQPQQIFINKCKANDSQIFLAQKNDNNEIFQLSINNLIEQKYKISQEAIKVALEYNPACRIQQQGSFYLSVAHNQEAIQYVLNQIDVDIVVLALGKNKDLDLILKIISNKKLYIILGKGRLRGKGEISGGEIIGNGGIQETLEKLKGQKVLVCGSFYIMKDVRQFLGFKDECDPEQLYF